ncbi:MAG TPA: tetratricopeptide repeat protein [Terriglobales bacterium]|nr:tetratricopeptide repeat protein [Terriglobales bacterium]
MTDDLYERYKEALRVGHVAVLRGALEEANEAYRAAASIAPSRALPHTSLGGVLLRLGHLEEALAEFAAAVSRAPHDEGALLGQAEALNIAGQRVNAAAALEHVSEVQEAAGRLPEAADTLRRAMELEESAERRRRQRGLLRQIRLSAGDQAAEQLLARALRLRDEPAAAPLEPARSATDAAPTTEPNPLRDAVAEPAAPWSAIPTLSPPQFGSVNGSFIASAPFSEVAALAGTTAERTTHSAGLAGTLEYEAASAEPTAEQGRQPSSATAIEAPAKVPSEVLQDVGLQAWPAGVLELAPPSAEALAGVGVMDGGFDTANLSVGETRNQPNGDELMSAAEAAELAGDAAKLRSLLVWTARAYAREGRFEAALDAAHRLLQRAPGDVDAHLVLVELYVARDWNSLAMEKLVLLGRLAELNDDRETHQRLCAVAARTFPKEERLSALCS